MNQRTTSHPVRSMKRLAGALAAIALSGMMLGAVAAPASAATGDSQLACELGFDGYSIYLPFVSDGYYSLYYTSVDGGAWGTSNWWYSSNFMNFEYTSAGWSANHSLYIGSNLGGGHKVTAWEYRYFANGTGQWVYLGSCVTTSFMGGGIIYR